MIGKPSFSAWFEQILSYSMNSDPSCSPLILTHSSPIVEVSCPMTLIEQTDHLMKSQHQTQSDYGLSEHVQPDHNLFLL